MLATFSAASYHIVACVGMRGGGRNLDNPYADSLCRSSFPSGIRFLKPVDFDPLYRKELEIHQAVPPDVNFPMVGLVQGTYINGNAAAFVLRSDDTLYLAFRGTN